jgi:valyl-tRNA synthetase
MDRYDLGMALGKVYDFIWSEFCDWYIEWAKSRLYEGDEDQKVTVRSILIHVLKASLKLLHPFMPFVTEKIWSYLPGVEGYLMMQPWPDEATALIFETQEQQIAGAMDIIRAVRNIRAEMKVPVGRKSRILLLTSDEAKPYLSEASAAICRLAAGSIVEFLTDKAQVPKNAMAAVCDAAQVFLPLPFTGWALLFSHEPVRRSTYHRTFGLASRQDGGSSGQRWQAL